MEDFEHIRQTEVGLPQHLSKNSQGTQKLEKKVLTTANIPYWLFRYIVGACCLKIWRGWVQGNYYFHLINCFRGVCDVNEMTYKYM